VIRVAVLSAEPDGPSVRHRWTGVRACLEEADLAMEIVPLPKAAGERGAAFARAGAADLTVLQRRLLRRSDFDRLRDAAHRLVYDFDDAMPYRDPWRGKPESTVRANRFLRTVTGCDAVVAGNEELAELARPCAPRALFVAPTPVDAAAYGPSPGLRAAGTPFSIGWIGSRSTVAYLRDIAGPLARITARLPGAGLLVVADADPELAGIPVERVEWTEGTERALLRRMDVGIMPLRDDPWSRGKCGFKLLQYGATGLPLVASPVGVNRSIVEPGVTGFLPADDAGWEETLVRLGGDPALRARLGAAARRRVEARWSIAVLGPPLAAFLRAVCERRPAGTGLPKSGSS